MNIFQGIALFSALTLFCLLHGLFWFIRSRRKERVDHLLRRLRGFDEENEIKITRASSGELQGLLSHFSIMRRLNNLLLQSGTGISLKGFLFVAGALLLGVFLLAYLLTRSTTSGLILSILTVLALYFYLNSRRNRRMDTINTQLLNAMELMTIGLRAGHTLEDTIRFAAEEMNPPLSLELRRVYEEYELGRPIEDALVNLSLRLLPCKALRTFVESVLILKQTGGNIIEIIEQIIESLRANAAYEARYRALTAEGRTSGMILGSLPLLILAAVMLVQPGYLGTLFVDSSGWIVLLVAGLLWMLGILWLIRLLRPVI